MDRMLVVVFNDEKKTFQAKTALMHLQEHGNLSVYGYAIVVENANRTATIRHADNSGPLGSLFGMSFGALVGALFGPAGLLLRSPAELPDGTAVNLTDLGIGQEFLNEVAGALVPGRVALIAEVDEDWTAPVDLSMEALGGVVLRCTLADVQKRAREENIATMRWDIAEFRAEMEQAQADQRAIFEKKIALLENRIQAQIDQLQDRAVALERRAQARAKLMEAKAAAAQSKVS